MRFMERMGHWLKAEGHGAIDAVEDKSLLLKQAVREAELALDEKRSQLDAVEARLKELNGWRKKSEAEVEQLDADIELALDQKQEVLARFVAKKLLPLRSRLEESKVTEKRLEEERDRLQATIAEQTHGLSELKERVRAYLERVHTGDDLGANPKTFSDEDVEIELLRRRRKRGES